MVETGHSIRPLDFDSLRHPGIPVEVLDRSDLLARFGPAHLRAPERLSFDAVLLMTSDRGSHTVDFMEIPGRAGRLVRLRPGQIQSWNTEADFDSTIVVSQPTPSTGSPWFPGHRAWRDLGPEAADEAGQLVAVLRSQQRRYDASRSTDRLLGSLFGALTALFDQAQPEADGSDVPEVYLAYRTAIEADVGRFHDVTDYANELGYSARTISRACHRVSGRTAKQVLTDRLTLEAKRLLVHTDDPAASIAHRLGFSEPTNFAKFVNRTTGMSPQRFRARHRKAA